MFLHVTNLPSLIDRARCFPRQTRLHRHRLKQRDSSRMRQKLCFELVADMAVLDDIWEPLYMKYFPMYRLNDKKVTFS